MAKKVIIATNNAHKVEEISDFFSALDWECESLAQAGIDSNPEETGTTLIENARIKARAAHELSGCAVLADDSGLLVDALDGAPGSIRHAMQERMETIKRTTPSCSKISHRLDLKIVRLTFPACCASSMKTEPRPLQKARLKG